MDDACIERRDKNSWTMLGFWRGDQTSKRGLGTRRHLIALKKACKPRDVCPSEKV